MTVEEALSVIEDLRKVKTDEEIVKSFFYMYRDDQLSFEEFEALSKLVGYIFPEDFKNLTDEERKRMKV